MLIEIPSTELRRGMQTFVPDAKGKMVRDVKLVQPFITSLKCPHLAWIVEKRHGKQRELAKVVYSPCSRVWIESSSP